MSDDEAKMVWDFVDRVLDAAEEINLRVIVHDPGEGFLLVINPKNKKLAAIGVQGKGLEICAVELQKWIWATDEGFTYAHLKKDQVLMDSIFKPVIGIKNLLNHLK